MTKKALLAATMLVALAANAKETKYKQPDVSVPPNWQTEAPFGVADPKDALPKGKWWTIYNDPELNNYEDHALAANQTLKAATARLREARAAARVSQAGLFPELDANPSIARQRVSGFRPNLPSTTANIPITQTVFTIPFSLNYELDLFGEVRNNVRSAQAALQASAADLENAQLVLTSELAADYFQLRSLDAEIADIKEALEYEQKGLDLVERRHQGGIASGLDVAQQKTVLDSALTQLSLLQQQRDQYQHALAVLQGLPAPQFVAPVRPLNMPVPKVPVALPSQLLERRPDIATAERIVASQNAQIGVAHAAFFPRIFLSAGGGVQSVSVSDLFSGPSALWSVGVSALQAVFAGGRIHARYEQSKAVYDESVANYRESVLVGFQQVEDALSALNQLAAAAESQQKAVEDSRRSLELANARYTGGLVSYLDVITAQEQLLANERLATQLLGQRVVTSVYLVKAIGGGWDAADLNSVPVKATFRQAISQ
ncbi:MAG TPA: efflux transporter outer membrane subunit [Terriglobales bacterium]|nr:efflux transporter outer membrane subunit [Terriglobales bacterium]